MKATEMPEDVAKEYLQSFFTVDRAVRAFNAGCQADENDTFATPATKKKPKSSQVREASISDFMALTGETDIKRIKNYLEYYGNVQNAVSNYHDNAMGIGEFVNDDKDEDIESDEKDDEHEEDEEDVEDEEDREDGEDGEEGADDNHDEKQDDINIISRMKLNLHQMEAGTLSTTIATVPDDVLQNFMNITNTDSSEATDYLEQADCVLEDALAAFYYDRETAFSMS
jgi:hypothetical protein